jgi:hypothetical protein
MPPEKITLGEIKEIIKAEKVSPSDLFGVESLTSDPLVRGFVDTTVKELKGKLSGEYEARKRVEKGSKENEDETGDEMKKKDDLIKKLQTDGAKRDAVGIFETKIKERKLDKQCSAFLKSKQGGFSPEDPEKLDKEVDAFMDKRVEEFKETAKIFGHKTEETKEDESKGGGEPGEGGEKENNELIPD